MGKLSRALAEAVKDPALNGRWRAFLPFSGEPTDSIHIESITPTHLKIAAQARFYGGRTRYYPGFADLDAISIIFYEDKDHTVTKFLDKWRAKIYDPITGNYGLPVDYWQPIVVEYYPGENSVTPTMATRYLDCWPTDQQAYELSYMDIDGRLTVSATFATNGSEPA